MIKENRIFLNVETESFKTRPGGPAIANIWLEVDGIQFPNSHFSDFAVVVMSWWALALLRLLCGSSTVERVHFMEGPYAVDVGIAPSGRLHFRALVQGATQLREMAVGEVATTSFTSDFISASRKMLDACKKLSWWSKEAEALETSLNALEEELAKL